MASNTKFTNLNANGDLQQYEGQATSSGAVAGDIVALNGSAQIDASLLPAIASSFNVNTETTDFSVLADDFDLVDLATAAANVVATLPDAATCTGKLMMVQVLTPSASHHVSFATVSAQTINGAVASALPVLVNVNQTYLFISDGVNFETVSPVSDLANNVTGVLNVVNGGTGAASLTAHNVILGNGTSAVALVTPSATHFALVSNGTSADPSFQALDLSVAVTGVLPVLSGPGVLTATAGSTSIPANAMIYIDAAGLIQLADNSTPKKATGFAPLAISSTVVGQVVMGNGPNTGLSGLSVGDDYFLSTAGTVTSTLPSTTGYIVQKVGVAVSATELQVILQPPVVLG
jgi:hypothetical protein